MNNENSEGAASKIMTALNDEQMQIELLLEIQDICGMTQDDFSLAMRTNAPFRTLVDALVKTKLRTIRDI